MFASKTPSDYHQPAQHNEPNPILVKLREQQPDWNHPYAEANAFDNANGAAWEASGEPDDTTFGTWWLYENHAYRVISRIANLTEGN